MNSSATHPRPLTALLLAIVLAAYLGTGQSDGQEADTQSGSEQHNQKSAGGALFAAVDNLLVPRTPGWSDI